MIEKTCMPQEKVHFLVYSKKYKLIKLIKLIGSDDLRQLYAYAQEYSMIKTET